MEHFNMFKGKKHPMPSSELKSMTIPIVILVVIYTVSILFFHTVEGWSFLDAAYFTTVTIATVGYGDFTPQTPLGKVGAIVLIFTGVSTGLYVITHVGAIREKTIDPQVQRRLEILRNLTSLQTGTVGRSELKKIKEKIENKPRYGGQGDEKNRGFGKL
jgi:voltage-gated potassium channel